MIRGGDGCLGMEAERWTDRTPAMKDLLNEDALEQRTAKDVAAFKMPFLDHLQATTDAPFENVTPQIQSLCQTPIKSLTYHRRALGLLIAAAEKDIIGTDVLPREPSVMSVLD